MNEPESNKLAFRLTEQSFRRYEKDIARIVSSFPTKVEIDPKTYDLATSTVAARLRDAMLSFHTYQWQSPIDFKKFQDIRLKVIVRPENNGKITVGSRSELTKVTDTPERITPTFSNTPIDLQVLHPLEVLLLVRLSEQRLLTNPLHLTGFTDKDYINQLEQQHDVAFDTLPDATFILR